MKGAVGTVVQSCGLDEGDISDLEAKMAEFAKKRYRTLAVAKTEDQNQLKLVGLVALYDAPRTDSKALAQELKELGISVKMLTGDALPIAMEIAEDVGLGDNIRKASDLKERIKENPIEAAELSRQLSMFLVPPLRGEWQRIFPLVRI